MCLIITKMLVLFPHHEPSIQLLVLLCDSFYALVEVLYLLLQSSDLGGVNFPYALVVYRRSVPASLHHPRWCFDHVTFVLSKNALQSSHKRRQLMIPRFSPLRWPPSRPSSKALGWTHHLQITCEQRQCGASLRHYDDQVMTFFCVYPFH